MSNLSVLIASFSFLNLVSAQLYSRAPDRILGDGYPLEVYNVETKDGYIITLHRIPCQNCESAPVVYMQHGLGGSSDSFLYGGPKKGIGYLAANMGFDVWLGNSRGNTYSRRHKTYLPSQRRFWNFTFHEIGIYDNAAFVDHILKTTGHNSLYYVGHSQGTTGLFILLAERPEYNKYIKQAHLMGPASFMGHMKNQLIRSLVNSLGKPNPRIDEIGSFEFLPHEQYQTIAGQTICRFSPTNEFCIFALGLINGQGRANSDYALLPEVYATYPAGASVNQGVHFLQLVDSKKFRQFDWGKQRNRAQYGTDYPPDYELSNVKTPIYLYYSDGDALVDVKDVNILMKELPNVAYSQRIRDSQWTHFDFLVGKTAKTKIYDKILDFIKKG